MTIKDTALRLAQGFVILTVGPVVFAYTLVATLFTICFWKEDDVGCPVAPPFISGPLICIFGSWN